MDVGARVAKERNAVHRAGAGGSVEWRSARVAAGHRLLDVGTRVHQDGRALRLAGDATDEQWRPSVQVGGAQISLRVDQGPGDLAPSSRARHVQCRLEVRTDGDIDVGGTVRDHQLGACWMVVHHR